VHAFKNPRTALATAMTSAALIGAGAVAAVSSLVQDDEQSGAAAPQVTVAEGAAPAAASDTGSVADIYRSASDAVVEITVSAAGETTPWGDRGAAQSQGSGFVYDGEGRVITNQHVVDGAESVSVRFADGTTYDAKVVGADPSTDIAVLAVDAPESALSPLELADSASVEVGEGVVAIGSPFGLEQTVTTGIVSALNRQITAPNNFAIDGAIQTDAAINKGNSGGPLLDLSGKVIGVNSQIESESGGNDGVGFAVPSNTVERVARALIADGAVEYAYLGVSTEDANRLRAVFGLSPIERFENNPEYFNADVTLQKRVRFSGVGMRVTVEGFNVFNIPQRNQPSSSVTAGTFGEYTSVSQPRAIQVTFQFDF